MNIISIILARGGSKGILNKNIIDFCGKPLLLWTIDNCKDAGIQNIYVSSDDQDILSIAQDSGVETILRPNDISGDKATSESGWLHALNIIEDQKGAIDWVLAPQVTSPLRKAKDVSKGIELAKQGGYDSLFSCSIAGDLFYWMYNNGKFDSINYDWKNRQRKQEVNDQYIENGSFYLFRSEILRKNNNRFGGKIGIVEMEFWQMFEIDYPEDLRLCKALMKEFILE